MEEATAAGPEANRPDGSRLDPSDTHNVDSALSDKPPNLLYEYIPEFDRDSVSDNDLAQYQTLHSQQFPGSVYLRFQANQPAASYDDIQLL